MPQRKPYSPLDPRTVRHAAALRYPSGVVLVCPADADVEPYGTPFPYETFHLSEFGCSPGMAGESPNLNQLAPVLFQVRLRYWVIPAAKVNERTLALYSPWLGRLSGCIARLMALRFSCGRGALCTLACSRLLALRCRYYP